MWLYSIRNSIQYFVVFRVTGRFRWKPNLYSKKICHFCVSIGKFHFSLSSLPQFITEVLIRLVCHCARLSIGQHERVRVWRRIKATWVGHKRSFGADESSSSHRVATGYRISSNCSNVMVRFRAHGILLKSYILFWFSTDGFWISTFSIYDVLGRILCDILHYPR